MKLETWSTGRGHIRQHIPPGTYLSGVLAALSSRLSDLGKSVKIQSQRLPRCREMRAPPANAYVDPVVHLLRPVSYTHLTLPTIYSV